MRLNSRIFFLLFGLLVILLLTLISVYLYWQNSIKPATPSPTPTPTTFDSTDLITPGLEEPEPILPTGFTGVRDEELPPDIKALSEQKQALKNELPYSNPSFNIEFNYGEDKFDVLLQEPKEQSRINFEEWLKKTYPAIPLDRFIFN